MMRSPVADALRAAEEAASVKDWSTAADLLAGQSSSYVLDRRLFFLSRAKRYDEALVVAKALVKRSPEDSRARYMAGYQLYAQEQYAAAIPWFVEAIRLRPGYIKALWRLANSHQNLGNVTQAQLQAGRLLREWHRLNAEQQQQEQKYLARASHLLARLQLYRDPAGAAALAEQAIAHDKNDPYHYYLLGKALRRANQPGAAVDALRRAQRRKRRDPHIESELASALLDAGEAPDAIRLLIPLVRRSRGWIAYKCGRLALRAGARELALEAARRAIQDRSTRSDPRVGALVAEAGAFSSSSYRGTESVAFVLGGRRWEGWTYRAASTLEFRAGTVWSDPVAVVRGSQ